MKRGEPEGVGPEAGPVRGPEGSDRFRAWLAPALLLVLAVTQLLLVATLHLSPWKGGGFGMFATNDHGAFRTVRLVAADGRRVSIPEELERLRRETRELPSPGHLRELVREVRGREPVTGPVRVEVWRTEFAPGDLAPSRRLVVELEVE